MSSAQLAAPPPSHLGSQGNRPVHAPRVEGGYRQPLMPELRQLHLQMQRPNLTLNRRPDMQDMARFQHSMRYPSRTHSQAQAGVMKQPCASCPLNTTIDCIIAHLDAPAGADYPHAQRAVHHLHMDITQSADGHQQALLWRKRDH